MMGNLVPSLPQFAKASFGMPGTLFRYQASSKIEFCLVYNEVMAFIILLSKLMQSLESNLGKTTQLRDENAFI